MNWVKHLSAVAIVGTLTGVACSSDDDSDDFDSGGSGNSGGQAGESRRRLVSGAKRERRQRRQRVSRWRARHRWRHRHRKRWLSAGFRLSALQRALRNGRPVLFRHVQPRYEHLRVECRGV